MAQAARRVEPEARDASRLSLTGHEVHLSEDDIIVSKTDPRGILTYTNRVFLDISGYTEAEVLGKPHSVIRHPHMPRCIFRLLWDTISAGSEIFAYVMNRCKNGDHYWVLAHVTPSYDANGTIVGYHSNRRAPKRTALDAIQPIYRDLLQVENTLGGRAGLDASSQKLADLIAARNIAYPEFILSL